MAKIIGTASPRVGNGKKHCGATVLIRPGAENLLRRGCPVVRVVNRSIQQCPNIAKGTSPASFPLETFTVMHPFATLDDRTAPPVKAHRFRSKFIDDATCFVAVPSPVATLSLCRDRVETLTNNSRMAGGNSK